MNHIFSTNLRNRSTILIYFHEWKFRNICMHHYICKDDNVDTAAPIPHIAGIERKHVICNR